MPRPHWHILLIDDNAEDRADLRQMLLLGGHRRYRFSEAELGAEGIRRVLDPRHGPVDCVLLDYTLPDMDARAVLAALCRETGMPPCPVVVITGALLEDGLQLLGAGAQDYIGKRWTSADSLTRAVENAIERFALLSERRRADAARHRADERYRALFDSIDAGCAILEMVFDAQGVAVDAGYVQVNPAFARQRGLSHAEGRVAPGPIHGIEALWFDTYGAVALTGLPARMEQHDPVHERWYDVFAFRLGEPQARQVAVLFNDISERKRAEFELIAASAEAERANRAKSEFLLGMSHELRSPLSAMLGFAQLIESGTPAPTARQQESVEQILRSGWYLLGLINEILDLSTIESGKAALSSQAVLLKAVLDDCQAMIAPQAQGSGIEIVFDDLPHLACVQADPIRTKQVLINLLSNAIKYNRSAGKVTVRCTVAAGHRVRVSVEDTGPGLAARQLAMLFQPFNRLGQESGTEPGTGIGLAICKRLVESMGGRIGVDSTVGVGSCFWFELDAAGPPMAHGTVPERIVLYVEADIAGGQQLDTLLARWPRACLLRARDMREGIELARSARPDMIVVGHQLSDPGGVRARAQLARDPITAHIPVIALGAHAVAHDLGAGPVAGLSGAHTQPLQSDAFVNAPDQNFQPTRPGGLRAAAAENT